MQSNAQLQLATRVAENKEAHRGAGVAVAILDTGDRFDKGEQAPAAPCEGGVVHTSEEDKSREGV